jgi:hypothetical protein
MCSLKCTFLLAASTLFLVSPTMARAAKPSPAPRPAQGSKNMSPVVSLRLSEAFLRDRTARSIEQHDAVRDVVLGAEVTGQSQTAATAVVEVNDQDQAGFTVKVTGRTVCRTTGQDRSALVHSRTVANFVATKAIYFDGRRFQGEPTRVLLTADVDVLGVDSTQPGLRGGLVRWIARNRVRRLHGQTTAIAKQKTVVKVQQAVDQAIESEVATLNRRIAWWRVLRSALGSDWRLDLKSTDQHLELQVMAKRPAPRRSAVRSLSGAAFPVELRIHHDIFGSRLSSWLGAWQDRDRTFVRMYGVGKPLLQLAPPTRILSLPLSLSTKSLSGKLQLQEKWVILGLADASAGRSALSMANRPRAKAAR